jgi:hypothetical protein
MPMWGMRGKHGNMSNQQIQNSVVTQKNTFKNDDLSITLSVPTLSAGISSNIELNIVYKSKVYEKKSPRLLLSIQENDNNSSRTVEFDAEGTFPVEYIPQSTGFANITVRLIKNEENEELMFVQQKITLNNNNNSFFSNPGTYIYGGLFMGAMMAVMIFADWH